MNEVQSNPGQSTRRLLIGAAVLETTAGVLGLAGLTLCAIAVAAVARRRVIEMEIPPSELARQSWAKARAATSAGLVAWRSMPAGPGANGMRQDRERASL